MRKIILGSLLNLAFLAAPAHAQLKATVTAHSVTLSWTASATPGVSYNVYRATATGGPFTETMAVTSPYTDTGVTAGTTYFYQVTAMCPTAGCSNGTSGESVPSNQVSGTIPSPPAAPTGLSIQVAVLHIGTQDSITATWQDVPMLSTFYVLFNSTKNYVQMNGAPTPNAAGTYSVTYTGQPFNGNWAICDAHNTCAIYNFTG